MVKVTNKLFELIVESQACIKKDNIQHVFLKMIFDVLDSSFNKISESYRNQKLNYIEKISTLHAKDFVSIPEGTAAIVDSERGIDFGSITSCLVVTVEFQNGRKMAAHCILVPDEGKGQKPANELLSELKNEIALNSKDNVSVSKVAIVGMTDYWSSEFLGFNERDLKRGIVQNLLEETNQTNQNVYILFKNANGNDIHLKFFPKPGLFSLETLKKLNSFDYKKIIFEPF